MKDITRAELIRSKEYWVSDIQIKLYEEVESYMKAHNMNRTKLAEHLGCTKGYITQLLAGDFDNKLSKLVELSLAVDKIPEISFRDIDEFILLDTMSFDSKEVDESTFFKKTAKEQSFAYKAA